MKKIVLLTAFFSVFCMFFVSTSGCTSGNRLYKSSLIEQRRLEAYRKRGADMCAPHDLAMAESLVEFMILELKGGNYLDAEKYLDRKDFFAARAGVNADICITTDRDGDGVPDSQDRCPDDPGPPELQGCPDSDGDGIPDIDDKCPHLPGPPELDGCPPEADRDGDGVPDSQDRCPDDPGPPELQGCPDRDGDGIPDIDDRCPDDPGPPELKGCPDRDGDGIPDIDDKCPDVPGVAEHDGCPPPKKYKMIIVTEKEIELRQTIFFETGKSVIQRKSHGLLREVADAINSSPRIKKVYIEGHTDSVGSRDFNLRLSQQRADAVKDFLISEGVDPSKLESKGYGPDRPIQSNRTPQGRAKNRRVEFRLEQ